jgi:hypothetical protein
MHAPQLVFGSGVDFVFALDPKTSVTGFRPALAWGAAMLRDIGRRFAVYLPIQERIFFIRRYGPNVPLSPHFSHPRRADRNGLSAYYTGLPGCIELKRADIKRGLRPCC